MMVKTALIFGASGLVGNEVLKLLLLDDNFKKVKAFVRKPLPVYHSKLEQHIVNFENAESFNDLIKGDILFCCLGTTIKTAGSKNAFIKVDYTYPLEAAQIAKKNGIESFLLISSVGADSASPNFYLKVKGDIETALKEQKFKSLIIVRPSMLLGNRMKFRMGEAAGKILMKIFSFVFISKLKKYKAIEAATVARAILNLSKSETKGINVFQSDQLQIIGEN